MYVCSIYVYMYVYTDVNGYVCMCVYICMGHITPYSASITLFDSRQLGSTLGSLLDNVICGYFELLQADFWGPLSSFMVPDTSNTHGVLGNHQNIWAVNF